MDLKQLEYFVRVAELGSCTRAAPALAVAQPAPNTLEAIDVQTLPGQQLQVTMKLSGPAPEPLSFTIDNPARICYKKSLTRPRERFHPPESTESAQADHG